MLFKLLCLHRNGVALSLPELAGSDNLTGNLVIQDVPASDALGRIIRKARLLDTMQIDMLPPLFDPLLVKMTEKQMTLQGYQIHAENGVLVHYAQYWELRMPD
jgi:hypothetical protein